MRQSFERAFLDRHGKVAVVTLNHDATINALSTQMVESLNAALDAAQDGTRGDDFRALIITGHGRGFCSGADMNELADRRKEKAGLVLERLYHPLLRRLRDWPAPIVTAVNGPAVGIGMSLALMGDLVVASRSARFLASFARIGLVPDGGLTYLLPRLVGVARARELALLADWLPAAQAHAWGMINSVADDSQLMDEATGLACRLADGPAALPLARKLFWDDGHEAQLAREAAAQDHAAATDDFAEGLAAYWEEREPKFKGR